MQGKYSQLDGGQELTYTRQKNSLLGSLLDRIIDAVNTLARNGGIAAVGKLPPPAPINSIQVQGTLVKNVLTCSSEHLHWTLTHNSEVSKGVQYITEYATEPNFLAPHIYDHGCSRTGFLHLPTLTSTGAVQPYYIRSYAQYLGSDAAKPTVLGGLAGATKILMTGTSQCSLLTSTGSGTASTTGMQGGKGLGDVLTRPAPGPKRSIA
jgi:hypothetical protein